MQSNISCFLLAHDPRALSVIGLQKVNVEEQAFGTVDQFAESGVIVHRQALEESLTGRQPGMFGNEPFHAVGCLTDGTSNQI